MFHIRKPLEMPVLLMGLAAFLCGAGGAFAAGNPGPGPTAPQDLPDTLEDVHKMVLELSWDFGDVEPPDWRKELVSDDPTANFRLRWKYFGPGFDSGILSVYDQYNQFLGEIALPLDPPAGDGYRYTAFLIGNLPGSPTLTMQVRVKDSQGNQIGCASNEAQITAPNPPDPFLYTPLFMIGLATDFGVPGIAGAVSCNVGGGSPDQRVYYDGVRRFDGGAGSIGLHDRWHIGSDTKAMTCTLLARLIQNGTLLPGGSPVVWDTSLSAVFPEWGAHIHARFTNTTLRHLACHRSGMRMTKAEDAETRVVGGANDDPRTFRRSMTYRLLTRQHYELDANYDETTDVTVPGTKYYYGSGNYLVLGAVIEQLLNMSYEQAMDLWLFTPLGMSTAAFGMPTNYSYYQPHGHRRNPDYPHSIFRCNIACPPIWNAAGSAYMSMQDWLKFLRLHLNGSEGGLTLSPSTLTALHTPYPKQSSDDVSYGFGWGISSETDGLVLDHSGSYGRFNARCSVHTGYGFAVGAAVNLGPNAKWVGGVAVWEDKSSALAVNALHDHLVEKAIGKQTLGRTTPGSFAAGSGGKEGILHINVPEDDSAPPVVVDDLLGPWTQISLRPAEFAPVSLYQLDEHVRGIASELRKPKSLGFTRDPTGLFRYRVSTEAGAVYQLWRMLDLEPRTPRELVGEVEATGPATEFEIEAIPNAPHGFFFVCDLEN